MSIKTRKTTKRPVTMPAAIRRLMDAQHERDAAVSAFRDAFAAMDEPTRAAYVAAFDMPPNTTADSHAVERHIGDILADC